MKLAILLLTLLVLGVLISILFPTAQWWHILLFCFAYEMYSKALDSYFGDWWK